MGISESCLVALTTESRKTKKQLPWTVLILKIELWRQHNVSKGTDQQQHCELVLNILKAQLEHKLVISNSVRLLSINWRLVQQLLGQQSIGMPRKSSLTDIIVISLTTNVLVHEDYKHCHSVVPLYALAQGATSVVSQGRKLNSHQTIVYSTWCSFLMLFTPHSKSVICGGDAKRATKTSKSASREQMQASDNEEWIELLPLITHSRSDSENCFWREPQFSAAAV